MVQDISPEPWLCLGDGLAFPEGPAFGPDGRLWGVELKGGCLFATGSGGAERYTVGGAPNGLAFVDGRPVFCDAQTNAISQMEADGSITTIVEKAETTLFDGPNDLALDPHGNLLFTAPASSRTEPLGTIWCCDTNGLTRCIARDLYFPNGLAFSPDGRDLVVAETYRHRLWRGRWDSLECRWIDPRPWAHIGGPTGPDGLAFASDGRLFVAAFGMGSIKVVGTDGMILTTVPVPGARPTNVALDPAGVLGLVVTEAEHGRLLSFPGIDARPCLFGIAS
ncbi:SMP-30/gluconolactonase/LRE family protein [Sphingobium algorifonticola]|uniref:SMP-30/gluconolactonase/LRE family protein n=1 Tax=Sphingobium algorifonticola TaxID=2008318 RepID=A0A437JDJ6_9SPHN|nr:SMP-30/gluconolactonase/LRE family protein [Sphingobium algorifonticola]RVT43813.1 SMP-30/gluconolactonase/LRE family protein [Sphingobium algorifonticola]